MKILEWFVKFFEPPARVPRRAKFLEGTQWTCPKCRALLATAKRDIYSGEVADRNAWTIVVPAWGMPTMHCGVNTMTMNSSGRHQIHTPTGWVG